MSDDGWLVIRKCETDPPEVWRGSRTEMEALFEKVGANWTETYLVRVIVGPGDNGRIDLRPTAGREAFVERWADVFAFNYAHHERQDGAAYLVRQLLAEHDARGEVASMRAVVEAAVRSREADEAAHGLDEDHPLWNESATAAFDLVRAVDAYRARKP